MEALERITNNQDWITLLLLGVLFLIVSASLIDNERLKQLFALPFNSYYLVGYPTENWKPFSLVLFLAGNLTLGLLIYLLLSNQVFTEVKTPVPFGKILLLMLLYWGVKFSTGKFIAFIFEIKNIQSKWSFVKTSYFLSSNLYLLPLLIFSFYLFRNKSSFLEITATLYALLLIIRYYHFINQYKREITTYFFYFILYLCALEIAPLLIVLKIGF